MSCWEHTRNHSGSSLLLQGARALRGNTGGLYLQALGPLLPSWPIRSLRALKKKEDSSTVDWTAGVSLGL